MFKFEYDTPKHFHRLTPTSSSARTNGYRSMSQTPSEPSKTFAPNGFSFGDPPPKTEPVDTGVHFFFLDDSGKLWYGIDENNCVKLESDLSQNPEILFADLQNAYMLGQAVEHLRITGVSSCDPVILALMPKGGEIQNLP